MDENLSSLALLIKIPHHPPSELSPSHSTTKKLATEYISRGELSAKAQGRIGDDALPKISSGPSSAVAVVALTLLTDLLLAINTLVVTPIIIRGSVVEGEGQQPCSSGATILSRAAMPSAVI